MSLTGSVIDIDINESRFDQLSDIFDELFEKEINHNYNVFQTDRQIRLLTEDIKEIRNIVVSGSRKFDGVIKGGLSKITITIPPIMNDLSHQYQTSFTIVVSRFKMRSLPQGRYSSF